MTAPLPRSLSQLSCLTSLNITQGEYDYAHRLFDNLGGPVVRRHTLERIAVVSFATAVMYGDVVVRCRHLLPWCSLQPLPPSLRVLDATEAPVESFCQLTALQHLGLTVIENTLSDTIRLGMLGQLTSLQLEYADWADWALFDGCTGLRALHLGGASCLFHAVGCGFSKAACALP